ncbi:hypothetical protein BBK82_29735 [Lentzea guizhouensis]|uniref:Uncharacterized protein n=1 Tax=Lentzea guizhouensis TaxID=1586287 RepID=A0A1B2HPH5_9PSEU|nr:hypothetical protein [Lentzea guizhouensis]ANZ39606.1 hypothetical protein BBK82_29735 [Lentzea guizhouensis]
MLTVAEVEAVVMVRSATSNTVRRMVRHGSSGTARIDTVSSASREVVADNGSVVCMASVRADARARASCASAAVH